MKDPAPLVLDLSSLISHPPGWQRALMPRNTYLVCYDICDDKRLRTVYKTMRDFGDHLQYSIFECQFTPSDLVRCRHALSEIIDHHEDQVLFVDLGPVEGRGDRVITALGKAYAPIDAPCIVVDGES
jgi:CRISPR-associated protein Cas2